MPFTVSYTGSTTEYRVAAPTKDNKDEEFYQRMNALAKNPEFDEEIMDLMVEECEEVFEDDDALYCFGDIDYGDGYEEFNSDGRIEVDGEEIDMGAEWVKEESNHKSEFRDLHEKLRSEVWSVEYYCQWKGVYELEVDEDKFDRKKLRWENSMIFYGDIPILDETSGRRPIAEEKILYWKEEYRSF